MCTYVLGTGGRCIETTLQDRIHSWTTAESASANHSYQIEQLQTAHAQQTELLNQTIERVEKVAEVAEQKPVQSPVEAISVATSPMNVMTERCVVSTATSPTLGEVKSCAPSPVGEEIETRIATLESALRDMQLGRNAQTSRRRILHDSGDMVVHLEVTPNHVTTTWCCLIPSRSLLHNSHNWHRWACQMGFAEYSKLLSVNCFLWVRTSSTLH